MRVLAICVIALLGLGRAANADPKGDVAAKIKQAMESYDLMDYEAARKVLNQALATAKKAKLDKDPIVARAYLDLGIIAFAMPDPDAAKLSFLSAVQIDPKIQLDPAYKTAEMAKLLDQARSEAGGGGGGGGGSSEAIETPSSGGGGGGGEGCSSVKGLDHQLIETANAGRPLTIEAQLGSDVKASRVSVMYRPEGATEFTEVKMTKSDGCKYSGTIPASGMHGSLVHYYVAAYGDGVKPVASKGSAGSPNIMELTGGGGGAAAAKGADDEDPINGGKPQPKVAEADTKDSGGEVSSTVDVGPKHPKVMIAVLGGGSSGYLAQSYMTEALNPVKSAGFGNPTAVVQPELGYYISPQLAIGVAARLGFPVGANVMGAATLAPAGLLRVHYALAEDGEGLRVMGQAGFGVIRNTIKLDNNMPGMDTDVVAEGPLLVGGGISYWKPVSGSVSFVADFSALLGVAVVSTLGTSPALNTGVTADFSIGLAFGL